MKKVRLYIKVTNWEECDKATNFLKAFGFIQDNFISTKCEGWVYGDDDGVIKFLMKGVDSYPGAHAKFRDYDVLYPYQLKQSIIDNHNVDLIKKLITQPIVTKKEYRNTIEVLEEVLTNVKENNPLNFDLMMSYVKVIDDLTKRLNKQ